MKDLAILILVLAAAYCAVAYGYLAYRTFRHREDWELESFHLGLCFILAVGFIAVAHY
jgi:NhaP-type Na+/H+ or K+/H+ antiporter